MPTSRAQQTASSSSKSKPVLEILPTERFIVFHGSEHEASSVMLSGKMRLTTPEAISISKPTIRLEGKRKIKVLAPRANGVNSRGIAEDKRVFWSLEQNMGVETPHKVKAGVMEWPFEFELSPSMPESVEGLQDSWIVYHLHASVSRAGWGSKDITAQEHIRLVRTLGPDSLGITRSRVNADIWADKLSYSISIPSDAIVFGTSVVADVELTPLKKGLRFGKIELKLLETVTKRVQRLEVPDQHDPIRSEEHEVAKSEMDFPEDSRVTYDEQREDPTMSDEMFKFQVALPLPHTLRGCRQDVDTYQLNVVHRFKLIVNIHNPAPSNHTSQLVCRLPVRIFISPNLPLSEDNEVHHQPHGPTDVELNSSEAAYPAPPQYGRHQLDQLYGTIDPSGFMSRAGSEPATPAGFLSRRASHDDLPALDGLASAETAENHGSAVPHQLHARLANLQAHETHSCARTTNVLFAHTPGSNHYPVPGLADALTHHSSADRSTHPTPPGRSAGGYFSAGGSATRSPQTSAPISRRGSADDHAADIQPQDYNLNNLSRVPSYGAALRTPGSATPFTDAPPSYIEAISRPSSPGASSRSIVLPRSLTGTSTPASDSSQQTLTATQLARLGLNPAPPTAAGSSVDEEARLQRLRDRG